MSAKKHNVTYETARVEQLIPHPDNTRDEVVPDEGLIASIREVGVLQPLTVAPHPTLQGDYTVIGGHHRLAAAKKAGLDMVPVAVHHDLLSRQAQVAALVQENLHRKDLTPAEEADAFQLMLSFDGYDAKRVAKETGVSQRRVRDRAKLTRLAADQRAALVTGQLTIERAEVLADFAGTPEEGSLLAAIDTHPTNWDWHVKRARQAREWRKKRPGVVASMEAAGVEVIPSAGLVLYGPDATWTSAQFETPEEAAKAGASVVVDERAEQVQYLLPRQPKAAAAKDEAAAARKALEAELNTELTAVRALEVDWIRDTVLPAAKAGDERTLRVLVRFHFDALTAPAAGWWTLRDTYLPVLRPATDNENDTAAALAGRSLAEQTALWVLASLRPSLIGCWAYERPNQRALRWFELRQALGWEWVDPEVRAIRELGAEDPLAPAADAGTEGVAA